MFFGASVSRNKSFTFTSNTLKIIFIQNIALDNKYIGNKTVYVNVETKGEKYTLCALRKRFREEYKCVFLFKVRNSMEKYKFSIHSEDPQAKVYLSGFIEKEIKEKDDGNNNVNVKDNDSDNVLSDNEEENIEELLNKKRKEKPLHFKPITLKKMGNKPIKIK